MSALMSAMRGEAASICSLRVFRILTRSGHVTGLSVDSASVRGVQRDRNGCSKLLPPLSDEDDCELALLAKPARKKTHAQGRMGGSYLGDGGLQQGRLS